MSSHICQSITLKGSTDLVTDFFKYAVNAILFQRGVYPADDFHIVKKYGQTVLVTQDLALENYLESIFKQIGTWLLTGATQLVVAIVSKESRMALERWAFHINLVEQSLQGAETSKPEAKIQAEIRSILRQIVSTVTFLPIIDEPTAFNIFVYTHESADVPANEWVDTDPPAMEASKCQEVKFRSFSTDVHRIETMVSWYVEENSFIGNELRKPRIGLMKIVSDIQSPHLQHAPASPRYYPHATLGHRLWFIAISKIH
jgi:mitotic spindle assembly checkpoint protein MAD2